MSVHQYKDGTWYIKYRLGKFHQKAETFGKGTKSSKAHKRAIARDKEIYALKALGRLEQTLWNQHTTTLYDIGTAYFKHLKTRNQLKPYRRDWGKILNKFVMPVLGDIPIENITAQHIAEVSDIFINRGNKPTTVNRYMGYLNQIFNFGIRTEMIEKNPMRFWEKLDEEKKEIQLTLEDARKIYAAAPDHLKWAMTVTLELVARFGTAEVFSLKWDDIDWEGKQLHCNMPKVKGYKMNPLSDKFIELLLEHKSSAKTDYLIEYNGKPIKSVKTAWKRAIREANLPYIPRPYDLRHLAISELVNGQTPISAVSKLAGHRNPKTTLKYYTHSNSVIERDAINQIPSLSA